MRILMLAPEPFFEPRGTPFSEFHRIRALTDLGHEVDLVTYPFGENRTLPGLQLFRCLRPPFVSSVKIGPSLAKVPLDFMLTLTAIRRALTTRYDVVHSHEEGGLLGIAIAACLRVPHLYDMHSSLPQQLTNFSFSRSALMRKLFLGIERLMIRRSRVVVVICPALEDTVRAIEPNADVVLIENAPGSVDDAPTVAQTASVRARHALQATTPVVLYTGTFEAYQGLDLLFEAMAAVLEKRANARLLLAGGKPDQVTRARQSAEGMGIGPAVIFAGERPAEEIPAYLAACDVLVSPRSRGTNTPLKIYQYLRAGKPIVATRLLTHTQVLSDDTAILTEATPGAFAAGILQALDDRDRAAEVGRQAVRLAETKYSYQAYLERTRRAYAPLLSSGAHPSRVEAAPTAEAGRVARSAEARPTDRAMRVGVGPHER